MAMRFGIEMECMGLTGNELKTVVEAAGAEFGGLFGYHGGRHCVPLNQWRAESDSTVTGGFCSWNNAGSHEVISPIMDGELGLRTIRKIAKQLTKAGASVDRTCGTHVHVGCGHLARWGRFSDSKRMRVGNRIIEIYNHFSNVFDAISPNNRFMGVGSWARTPSLNRSYIDRYTAVNMTSWILHGRVEFRQAGFTLNPDVIEMWLRIVDSVVKSAMNDNHKNWNADLSQFTPDLSGFVAYTNCGVKAERLLIKRLDFCISQYRVNRPMRMIVRNGVRRYEGARPMNNEVECISCQSTIDNPLTGQNLCAGCE